MTASPTHFPASRWLTAAAGMSAVAGALHIGCILGGPDWYRFFGAGEAMAQAAERGELAPTIIALGIATILLGWTIYGLSAAGYPPKLPLTRTALVAISTVLLLRAMAVFLPILWEGSQTATFMIWSSAIVGVLGITFAIGTWLAWGSLSGRTGG